jgi:hypothetical protein
MKNKNKDALWKKERGMALNIGELAEVSGYSRGEISRQISHLLIGGKLLWDEYVRWRTNEQERLAKDAGHSQPVAPEAVAPQTEADRRWKEIEDRFYGRRKD